MTKDECVKLDHVFQMYHLGFGTGRRPSSIRELQVESATSITVQHVRAAPPHYTRFVKFARAPAVSARAPAGRRSDVVQSIRDGTCFGE